MAIDFYKGWYSGAKKGDHPQYFSYSGPAGSGKTTVLRGIITALNLSINQYVCCAFAGKAAQQIVRNGLPAQTFHSLIYNPNIVKVLTDEFYDSISQSKKDHYFKHTFKKNEKLPANIKLIVVDETTMLNDYMIDDLLSFNIPVIFIGDRNQLPPIQGKCRVMDHPDFELTEIMRQEENSPIVQLSQMILNGEYIPLGKYGNCNVIEEIPYGVKLYNDYDIVLTCKNKSRDFINNYIRETILRRDSGKIYIGDKVINRHNERDYNIGNVWLTNGTIGYVTDINSARRGDRPYVNIDFRPDFLKEDFEELLISTRYLTADYLSRQRHLKDKFLLFEYAYAITVHLSQGSEFDDVLYVDESFHPDVIKNLRYTAITRAKNSVDIVAPKGLFSYRSRK